MTSDAITARNAANARKSTGPRTAEGKARVSSNARRHGATARPDPKSVAAWVCVILDRPDLTPAELLSDDPRVAAALALAQAEVRLGSAKAALDAFERGETPPSDELRELQGVAEQITADMETGTMTAKDRRAGFSILRRIQNAACEDTARGGRRHRLLNRYLREARGHRNRAFQNWLDQVARSPALVWRAA